MMAEYRRNVETMLFGATYVCDADRADCPLKDLRELDLRDRLEVIRAKSDDELVGLFEKHESCRYQGSPAKRKS